MKNLTKNQIEAIKTVQPWHESIKGFTKEESNAIIGKMLTRHKRNNQPTKQSVYQQTLEVINMSKFNLGTNYYKVMYMAEKSVCYAHPRYLDNDYNMSVLFDRNKKTEIAFKAFTAILERKKRILLAQ
jgi:hypothetical protein